MNCTSVIVQAIAVKGQSSVFVLSWTLSAPRRTLSDLLLQLPCTGILTASSKRQKPSSRMYVFEANTLDNLSGQLRGQSVELLENQKSNTKGCQLPVASMPDQVLFWPADSYILHVPLRACEHTGHELASRHARTCFSSVANHGISAPISSAKRGVAAYASWS